MLLSDKTTDRISPILTVVGIGLLFFIALPSFVISSIGLKKYFKHEIIRVRGAQSLQILLILGGSLAFFLIPLTLLQFGFNIFNINKNDQIMVLTILHTIIFVTMNIFMVDTFLHFTNLFIKVKRCGMYNIFTCIRYKFAAGCLTCFDLFLIIVSYNRGIKRMEINNGSTLYK